MTIRFGILTANARQGGLGGNRANFARLIRAAAEVGQSCPVYAIEPDGQLSVYVREAKGGGYQRTVQAVPAVLYNRIPTRSLERSEAVKRQLAAFTQAGVIVTNPRFLQKDEVLTLWQQDAQLRPYVPEAVVVTDGAEIVRFLRRYGTVYAKPIDGMAGVGILQLRRERSGVLVRLQKMGHAQPAVRMGQEEAVRYVLQKVRRARHVLQAGADVARYDGRRFDFRLLLQMGDDQKMQVTGAGIRVGPRHGMTTHVPNGGQVLKPDPVLQRVFGTRAADVRERVMDVAQLAASQLTRLPGVWSECSLDIGVTTQGHPCLFEANAKPMKFDEKAIERAAKRQLVARLLELAR